MSKETTEPHVHSHSHSEIAVPVSKIFRLILLILVGAILLITSIGAALTWPNSTALKEAKNAAHDAIDFPNNQYAAVVDHVEYRDCSTSEPVEAEARSKCNYILFDVKGRSVAFDEGKPCINNQPFNKDSSKQVRYCVLQSFDPNGKDASRFQEGQNVVVSYRNADGIDPQFRYSFADQDRRGVLVAVVILFLVTVIIFGALRGMLAVAGLLLSLFIIGIYILPALVAGENGLLVALIGGTAVAAAALYLSHGFNSSTHIAFLSSIGSVLSIALFAQLFFTLGRFTGFVSEEASYLSVADINIDLRGLLIAGAILASLGALDDMTVTQVAAVSELHNARPDYKFAQLWRSAVRIGRDHVASTVNTLALAYVGTSLALMLLFTVSRQSFMWIANSESVAVQIVGALVGSFGLIVSVPLSTALAAYAVHTSEEHEHHEHDYKEEKNVEENEEQKSKYESTEQEETDLPDTENDAANKAEDDFWKR